MDTARWRKAARIATAIVVSAPALWQLSLEARLYLARVGYRQDVEWLEGAALYQAYRVMLGQSTYGPPQNGYLPLLHPPVFPTFLGLVGRITGLSYGMAHTVSMLFFVGACLLVVRELIRHEEDRLTGVTLALLAVGCSAAGVPFFEGFYDMVREDIMSIFLCVLGATLVPADPKRMKPRRILLLSLVLTAALYARFPLVFFLVWIVLYVFARHRRTGVILALTLASACGITLVILQYVTRGWFWMYTVTLLQDHKLVAGRVGLGLTLMAQFAPYLVAIPIVAIILIVTKRLSARAALWLGMLGAAFPAALLPFAKVGGFANDFMPVAFFAGPAAIFVASDAIRAWKSRPRAALVTRYVIFLGFAGYLVARHYDYTRFVPTADTRKKAEALNKRVASLEGGVITPRHPFLAIQNGHTSTQQFADMPYLDALWAGFKGMSLGPYMDKIHAQWAIVTGTEIPYSAAEVAARYQYEGSIGDAPQMVIGERSLVRYLMRWNDDEKDARVLFDFEDPALPGWTKTGEAFSSASIAALPRGQGGIVGVTGQRFADSYNGTDRDAAVGTLTSPTFVIDRRKMSMRIGGWHYKTRVELRVGGRVPKKGTGIFEGTETMTRIVWDLTGLEGKEAQLVLIDDDAGPWGHMTCDQVVLYN